MRLSTFELRDCDGVQRQDGVTNLIFLFLVVSAPPGCQPCPKSDEGLFDTPICGKNGIAYKNFCYLTLRNCIAKILKKEPVFPSSDPKTCG